VELYPGTVSLAAFQHHENPFNNAKLKAAHVPVDITVMRGQQKCELQRSSHVAPPSVFFRPLKKFRFVEHVWPL